jgi:hypothetical protein
MAQKVFVSPGVYTTESELSFVAQSVGVTTLGIAGETLKGPAFEPIFITNYDEFQTYFGTTSPEKFVNTQIPKYELPYIAKSYLQQSNQLFVTRVLGLSGYDAGPSWSILSVANVDSSTVEASGQAGSFTLNFTGNTSGTVILSGGTFGVTPMGAISANTYTRFNGTTSTIESDIIDFLLEIASDASTLSATTSYQWGPMSGVNYSNITNVLSVTNLETSAITYTSRLNDAWYYALFSINDPGAAPNDYSGNSFNVVIDSISESSGVFSGTISGNTIGFDALAYVQYNNLVLATLRSRGITDFTSTQSGTTYQVNDFNAVAIDVTGAYSAATLNPFEVFEISGTEIDSTTFTFEVSLDDTSSNFISKVLGTGNFQKDRNDVPLFVEERFPTMLNYGYNQGYIRGIKNSLIALDFAKDNDTTSLGNYLEQYQTAYSPWVVSELRGNTVFQLFRFITISDGDSSNKAVKVSIANMSFDNDTFDVLVRDYYDSDANPVVIEKYTNCTMDPSQNSFVGVKIGTADGEYQVNSRYIMLELNPDAPVDALPCGFEGYLVRTYENDAAITPLNKVEVFPIFKTKYFNPGDQVSNPPFGNSSGNDDSILSNGENVRRAYLGFSTSVGWDENFFDYKGKQTPSGWTCTEQTYNNWYKLTKGFHMDSGATAVTISSQYSTSGTQAFDCGIASFRAEPESPNDPYYRTYSRKFTLLCGGGFDGWDIYREYRTNGDNYQLGKSGFLYGSKEGCPSYPNASGWGAFRQITIEDDTTNWANTDFYAYKLGISTFSNPGIININVFATPGVDYINNYQLVKAAVDMIEIDRADSIYITTTPDFELLQPSLSMDNFIYPQDAVDNLATEDIDSNYTSTYYPWVLTRDSVNNTQIYIPPTAEVCRNLALTDNISFPWFATAGYTRGIVNAVRARRRLTQLDRDTLYQGRINPIATFNDVGTVIWGNKTLQVRESPLDRLNVRRLLLQARKLISAVAIRLLFEQNDAVVRQQFLDSVNPILDAIRRDRGIFDFRVTVDSSPEALDSNQMSGKIFIKPTKALEFIDIEFIVTPQGASFENI